MLKDMKVFEDDQLMAYKPRNDIETFISLSNNLLKGEHGLVDLGKSTLLICEVCGIIIHIS